MSYFPMFVQLEGASCLVVGGGAVAARKVRALLDFGAQVTVVAPEIGEEIRRMEKRIGRGPGSEDSDAGDGFEFGGLDAGDDSEFGDSDAGGRFGRMSGVTCLLRGFQPGDLDGRALVVAATGDAALNHRVSLLCREKKIPVNAVDQKEDCTFIFPSYVKRGEVTAAVSSGGSSPLLARYLREQIEEALPESVGPLAEALGAARPYVKEQLESEEKRREVFRRLLAAGLEKGEAPGPEEIERLVREMKETEKPARKARKESEETEKPV